jgi:hypothetical protein
MIALFPCGYCVNSSPASCYYSALWSDSLALLNEAPYD